MPKPYKYYLLYGENTVELDTDPMGLEEYSFGFTRSEDFGLNVGSTISLSFLGNAYTILKTLYETQSIFAKAYIVIKERNNLWTFDSFYKYRLDFTKYENPPKTEMVKLPGIEEGLLSSFQTYADTEYEIDLPTEKRFLSYDGVNIERKNILQCSYGSIQDLENEDINEDAYVLRASRSVRAYTDALSFVNDSGEPFNSMTIKCVKDTSFDLSVSVKCTVIANGTLFNPSSGTIKVVKYNPTTHLINVLKTFNPITSSVSSSKRKDVFSDSQVVSVTIQSGEYIYVAYYAESGKLYDDISVEDCYETTVSVTSIATASIENPNLEVFTYEWLINALLQKIETDSVLQYNLTDTVFEPLLSATPCIKNMGAENGTGKLKVSLSDVLKSLDCLYCIGIDVTQNTMTIDYRQNFYKNVKAATIEAKDIVVKHATEDQFNKINVGYDTEKMDNESDLFYPFNCEKVFEIKNSVVKNELDIKNPFKADPYEIQSYINEVYSEADNTTDCEFVILCATPILSTTQFIKSVETKVVLYNEASQPIQTQVNVTHTLLGTSRIYDSKVRVFGVAETPDGFTPNGFIIEVKEDGVMLESFSGSTYPNVSGYTTVNEIPKESDITVDYVQSYEVAEFTLSTFVSIRMDIYYVYSESKEIGFDLYKDHTITNFNGDEASVFNVPITPKRILQKHLSYASISNYCNAEDIKFVSTDIDSAITSRCGFESVDVVENADVADTTPMFLPINIECNAVAVYGSGFNTNKYAYYEIADKKSGKVYQGWIKSITFAPNRNKANQLILQAKAI